MALVKESSELCANQWQDDIQPATTWQGRPKTLGPFVWSNIAGRPERDGSAVDHNRGLARELSLHARRPFVRRVMIPQSDSTRRLNECQSTKGSVLPNRPTGSP